MKMIPKVFLNFLVCWSLLFTQMALGTESGGDEETPVVPPVLEIEPLSLWEMPNFWELPIISSFWGDDDEEEVPPGSVNYSAPSPDASPTPASSSLTLTASGCGFVDGISGDLPGIGVLSDYFESRLCSNEAFSTFTRTNDQGELDAVDFCRNIQAFDAQNLCPASVITPQGMNMAVAEFRQSPEMRELEIENKAKVMQEEAQELGEIMQFQAGMASDISVMNYLYNKVKNRVEDRERFKELFNLDDSFFTAEGDQQMALSEFTRKVFQCLPDGEELENVFGPDSLCHGAGDSAGNSGILQSAAEKMIENCNGDSDCLLQSGLADRSNLMDILAANVGDRVAADAANTGNIAILDEGYGLTHLNEAMKMMNWFNQDTPNSRPAVINVVSAAIDNNVISEEERLNVARRTALDYSLNLIRTKSTNLKEVPRRMNYFNGFIDSITSDGILNLPDFMPETIEAALAQYGQATGESLFEVDEGQEMQRDEIEKMVALVQRAAVGQRMGDYVYNGQRQLDAAIEMTRGPGVSQAVASRNTLIDSILNQVHGGAEQARSFLENFNRETNGTMPILSSAAAMLGQGTFREGEKAHLAGMRKVLERFDQIFNRFGDSMRGRGANQSPEELYALAGLESFASLIEDSARKCRRKKDQKRLRHRYCTPFSDAEFGQKALENLLGGINNDSEPSDVINHALFYCTPILKESTDRSMVANNQNPEESSLVCDTQTRALFCDSDCPNPLPSSINESQELLFGQTCDGRVETPADGIETLDGDSVNPDGDFTPVSVADATRYSKAPPPKTTEGSFDSGLRATRPTGRRNSYSGVTVATQLDSNKPVFNAQTTRRDGAGGATSFDTMTTDRAKATNGVGANNTFVPSSAFTAPVATDVVEDLSGTLREQEDVLDPASRALLQRLEEMEARQAALQRELERNREREDEGESEERAALLAELKKLKAEIPRLEEELKEREDVGRALAQANVTPEVETPTVGRLPASFGGGRASTVRSGGSGGPAGAANNAAAVANTTTAPAETVTNSGPARYESGVTRSGGGPEFVAPNSSGLSPEGEALYTSQSVIQLTEEIRSSARIFPPGVVPSEAVLEAGGPILIPLGEDGQFIMYEPELTVDGEIKTENGQVVFRAIVKVSEDEVSATPGRLPASLEPDAEVALPAGYEPRRLFELDSELDKMDFEVGQ